MDIYKCSSTFLFIAEPVLFLHYGNFGAMKPRIVESGLYNRFENTPVAFTFRFWYYVRAKSQFWQTHLGN
jgi:hypothetical protein